MKATRHGNEQGARRVHEPRGQGHEVPQDRQEPVDLFPLGAGHGEDIGPHAQGRDDGKRRLLPGRPRKRRPLQEVRGHGRRRRHRGRADCYVLTPDARRRMTFSTRRARCGSTRSASSRFGRRCTRRAGSSSRSSGPSRYRRSGTLVPGKEGDRRPAQKGSRTQFIMTDVRFDVPVSESMFSLRNLATVKAPCRGRGVTGQGSGPPSAAASCLQAALPGSVPSKAASRETGGLDSQRLASWAMPPCSRRLVESPAGASPGRLLPAHAERRESQPAVRQG